MISRKSSQQEWVCPARNKIERIVTTTNVRIAVGTGNEKIAIVFG